MTDGPGRPRFARRLVHAAADLLVPLQASVIVAYFAARWLGQGDVWLVDALGYVLPWLFLPSVALVPAALVRRSRLLLGLALAPVALFALTYGHLFLPRAPVRADGPVLTVLTHNVRCINEDAEGVAAAVEAHGPDFFALRELWPPLTPALEERFAAAYPYHRVEPGCGFWSRHPILDYQAYRLAPGAGELAQQVVLDVEGRRVTVISVHPHSPPIKGFHLFGQALGVSTGFDNEMRDAELRGLLARSGGIEGPLIVVGDLNLTDQQAPYGALTHRLLDAHRESGRGMGFTYMHFPSIGLALWRIDYVFYSPDLAALSTAVEDYGGSDHRPLVARLAFR